MHDVLNIFQVEGLTRDGDQCFIKRSPAKKGDFFEFFVEIDLLYAISTCPGGDLSVPLPAGPSAERASRRGIRTAVATSRDTLLIGL